MKLDRIYNKSLQLSPLSKEEVLFLYKNGPTSELMFIANEIRRKVKSDNKVTWMIDRNVNISNICVSKCQFCNFCRDKSDKDSFITTIDEYKEKIDKLILLGGEQLLLQGGISPKFNLKFYSDLFRELKNIYPNIKLHALGPPEIAYVARIERMSHREVLEKLVESGLDSLPGAGAEILSDRVRKTISPGKCNSQTWLDVMREAHKLNLVTSATMMLGHIESIEERVDHLLSIREVQSEKPDKAYGFIAFIPWPFQSKGTILEKNHGVINKVTADEYIRTIAISRIVLNNIENIQASWLTVGKETGQICLHSGANDFGSIMIEENVVSSAGASHKFDAEGIQKAIIEAGFEPQIRNQKYEYITNPVKS